MRITKGLIIADPWIGHILEGSKTWEMRSSAVVFRGWFGLIRKGTGAIYGVAHLVCVGPPLPPAEMIATFERHRIPEHMIRSGKVAKWNTPWKLAGVLRLVTPVPYKHRSGAVTWVELDPDTSDAVGRQLGALLPSDLVTRTPVAPRANRQSERPLRSEPFEARKPTGSETAVSDRLIGQVELSQGNIDNNHIYLRSFFHRFPDDAIGGSNRHAKAAREVSVEWGSGAPISTDLDGSKRFFRARGWIRNFFELNDAQAGDTVLVDQTGPYAYRLRLSKKNRGA